MLYFLSVYILMNHFIKIHKIMCCGFMSIAWILINFRVGAVGMLCFSLFCDDSMNQCLMLILYVWPQCNLCGWLWLNYLKLHFMNSHSRRCCVFTSGHCTTKFHPPTSPKLLSYLLQHSFHVCVYVCECVCMHACMHARVCTGGCGCGVQAIQYYVYVYNI